MPWWKASRKERFQNPPAGLVLGVGLEPTSSALGAFALPLCYPSRNWWFSGMIYFCIGKQMSPRPPQLGYGGWGGVRTRNLRIALNFPSCSYPTMLRRKGLEPLCPVGLDGLFRLHCPLCDPSSIHVSTGCSPTLPADFFSCEFFYLLDTLTRKCLFTLQGSAFFGKHINRRDCRNNPRTEPTSRQVGWRCGWDLNPNLWNFILRASTSVVTV